MSVTKLCALPHVMDGTRVTASVDAKVLEGAIINHMFGFLL
jgi:hypothetical protein